MEQFSYPEPMPSMSTPVQSTGATTETAARGRRRHTITRPDSAMALLSDMEEDEDEDQEAFDRISGILSTLIQEANQAVHGIEQERVQLLNNKQQQQQQQKRSKTPRSSTSLSTDSRLPRPRKSRIPQQEQLFSQQQQQQHHPHHHHGRHGSTSSITSSTSTASTCSNSSVCFSPTTSTSSSVITTQSRSPSPKQQILFRHTALRPRSCPVIAPPPSLRRRGSHTPKRKIVVQDPLLMESFKRLDSSMAVVDSLSRDLAKQQIRRKQNKLIMDNGSSSKLTLLLLIPLLHIPHSLITMVFDFCSSPQPPLIARSGGNGSFTVMMFWACLFTVANLMVDSIKLPKRRLSLPGTFKSTTPSKRTWTPSTKTIVEEKPTLKRRNSI